MPVSQNEVEIFERSALQLNAEHEINRISNAIREAVMGDLHRRGAIIGISGGIDSSVVLALTVRALGAGRVIGIMLPEDESSPESADLATLLAGQFGVETITENISAALEGAGCYRRRDEAIRRVVPQFSAGWKSKITLPGSLLDDDTLNVFYLTAVSPAGEEIRKRIPPAEFSQIMAASNFKQRIRMAMLYYHAELRNYAVIGTANKNEHELGFFVKHGDGGVDIAPIQHLFKSQVYQLARSLDIPRIIQERPPTSDTYSAGSTQEEFFFRLPFETLDAIWYGHEHQVSAADIAIALGLTTYQVERIIRDIQRKQQTTAYLRRSPISLG